MHKHFFIALLMICSFAANAQYAGYSPIADVTNFKTSFAAASQKTQTIKSNFVQEKNLSMLSEKIVSKGKFWFKKESMVRMEYTQPFQYLMVINKDKVFVKDGAKENTVSSKSNKIFQQINKIVIDCMQGTMLGNTDFKTRVFESKLGYLVELIPTAKKMKELFKNINVVVDKKDDSVNSIEMYEPGGDNTLIRFVNKELNTTVQDALFTIK